MTEMIRELYLLTDAPPSDSPPRLRAGDAFVPCSICLRPLDLALIADEGQPQLCDRHRVGELFPLH
jgi:hypothetical protein